MNIKQILVALLLLVVLGGAVTYYLQRSEGKADDSAKPATQQKTIGQIPPRVRAVSMYVTENLATLSPVKPAAGRQFRITKISISTATGSLAYTDGVKEYVADFSFTVDASQKATIQGFTLEGKK